MELDRSLSASSELRSGMMQEIPLDRDQDMGSSLVEERRGSIGPVMDPARFSILDTEGVPADAAALQKVQGQLRPQGFIANLVDTIWNRGIAALFSSDQRQLNAARDLLAKPTEDLTTAMNHFASLSAQVQRFGGAPITLQNVEQYAAALKTGMILVEVEDETAPNGVRLVSREPNLQTEIDALRFGRLTDGLRITDLEGLVGGILTGKTPMTLLTSAKAVATWNQAIQTAGKDLSDAEFRGLVTQANANAVVNGANREFVEANTVTTWADVKGMGQSKFVNEAAREFSEAVKGLEAGDNNGSAVRDLTAKIDARAAKIGEVLGTRDTASIKEQLLNQLNQVPSFKETLMEAQDKLRTVVENNQSHAFLAAEQMDTIGNRQQAIIDSEKTSFGDRSVRKGEAAVVGTFSGLLTPEATRATLELHGQESELDQGGAYETVAQNALLSFRALDQEMRALFTQGNAAKVAEGQERAEAAIAKLDDLNELISASNTDQPVSEEGPRTWNVNTGEGVDVNRPIPEEALTAEAVAGAVKQELLTMIQGLARQADSEASPTLLAQLMHFVTADGLAAVDPRLVIRHELFANETIDGRDIRFEADLPVEGEEEATESYGVTMLKFAGQRPESELIADERPIAGLRGAIEEIREEQAEALRAEQAEAMERARLERLANPTTMDKVANFFKGLNPFGSSTESADQADRTQTVSLLDLDEPDFFEDREVTPEPSFGTKVANFFRGLNPFGSKDPVEPEHRGFGADFGTSSRFNFDALEEEPLPFNSGGGYGTFGGQRRGSTSSEEDLFLGQTTHVGQNFDLI